jgi:hypothetical protein
MATYTSVHTGTKIDKAVSQFDDNGFLLNEESGRAWVDVDFPFIVRTTGGGRPAIETLQGNITAPQWAIGNNLVLEGQELVHAWVEGTELQWHTHMITNGVDNTDRYVNFQLEFTWAKPNGQLQSLSTVTSTNFLIPANTPDRTHLIVPIHTFTPTEGTIGSHVYAYFSRIAATDAAAAPTNNPFLTMLQVHIQVDTLGSRQVKVK